MLIALNEKNERVSSNNAKKSSSYFCPICHEHVSVKALDSLAVRPHFAHKKGTECLDNWKHDMSEWHYNWQCQFPEEYREIVVEKNGIKHRADILIDQTVIEFQHSPITGDEISKRNIFYTNCGYRVIWVFDANNKVKNAIQTNESTDPSREVKLEWKRSRREFLNQSCQNVLYFIEYNTEIATIPPQKADILLFLENIHPKNINYLKTKLPVGVFLKYFFINRDSFVEWFIPSNKNIKSAQEIIAEAYEYIEKTNIITKKPTRSIMISPSRKLKRKFHF